ncbi:hypothetical protein [Albimonas pacifica]|uniref:hypothetical protein n=1 Tax=Albimonas pacifica TaxID=1114924 RepID=UPI001160ACA4|nr:hypothetical protein [Albimonas pacifica]
MVRTRTRRSLSPAPGPVYRCLEPRPAAASARAEVAPGRGFGAETGSTSGFIQVSAEFQGFASHSKGLRRSETVKPEIASRVCAMRAITRARAHGRFHGFIYTYLYGNKDKSLKPGLKPARNRDETRFQRLASIPANPLKPLNKAGILA